MDTNFSLPAALLMTFLLAPPVSMAPLPVPPEPEALKTALDGQETLFARNVRTCLRQMAPLMPAWMRDAMAEDITAQWNESGLEGLQFATETDMDEAETLAETMEEEVLPALEDAGLEGLSPRTFRMAVQAGAVINRVRVAECATQYTVLQLQIGTSSPRQAATGMQPDDAVSSEEDAPTGLEDATRSGGDATDSAEEAAGLQHIAY